MLIERKNKRIRKAMTDAGIVQATLAQILGESETAVSFILKYELAKQEQDDIIKAIKDYAAKYRS